MNRLLVSLLLALAPVAAAARPVAYPFAMPSPYEPAQLRRHYELAAADKAAGEKFYQLLAEYHDQDALVLGYKAAARSQARQPEAEVRTQQQQQLGVGGHPHPLVQNVRRGQVLNLIKKLQVVHVR